MTAPRARSTSVTTGLQAANPADGSRKAPGAPDSDSRPPDPELHRAEPKTLSYRLLHTAARSTRGQRKVFLRLAQHWPWALALAKAITRLRQIPLPA